MALLHAQARRRLPLGKSHSALTLVGALLTVATSLPAQANNGDCDGFGRLGTCRPVSHQSRDNNGAQGELRQERGSSRRLPE